MNDEQLKVYIASSWRNAHGVEMLTQQLRIAGCYVYSWVENNYGEDHNHVTKKMDFEKWVASPLSDKSFDYDTNGAADCDIFIYYAPAGNDACAELGIAYAESLNDGKLMWGLWAKGEGLGLMRKMIDCWFERPGELIIAVHELIQARNSGNGKGDTK